MAEEPEVSTQAFDVLFKLYGELLSDALPTRFGIHLPPVVRPFPTELPRVELRTERLDDLFELRDASLLHHEYQSTHTPDTLPRFLSYDVALYLATKRTIHTLIFYGPRVRKAPSVLNIGSIRYQVHQVFLGREDGEAVLAVIRRTLDQGKPLTPNQQADLVFAPIMGRKRRSQVEICGDALDQALRIADEADQQKAMGSILALAYHVLERPDFDELMERLTTMHSDVLDRVYRAQEAKGLKQGIEQGRVEAEQRDILRVLAVRLGPVPEAMAARVAQVSDSARLAVLLESAATATNLAEFERGLD
jgi:hypothetical protein